MTKKYPYIAAVGTITKLSEKLKAHFPSTIDAKYLQSNGIAAGNENLLLNIFRFIGIIDENGQGTDAGKKAFNQHIEAEFEKAFKTLIETAYAELFDNFGSTAWTTDRDSLIQFFRSQDQTSAVTGKRQAQTFEALAALSGHGDIVLPRSSSSKTSPQTKSASASKSKTGKPNNQKTTTPPRTKYETENFSLSVRLEINLPSDASAETYDNIFASIRKNLIDKNVT